MKEKPRGLPRREFLAAAGLGLAAAACRGGREAKETPKACPGGTVDPNAKSRVVLARTGSPEGNARALLAAWGGVEGLVGPEDIVVLKVNAQWYAQGMTNTDVLAEVIRAILERPGGFQGEILLADNHHDKEFEVRGWTTHRPNGRWNYNDLVKAFQEAGHANVAKVHWRDAGPNPEPWQFPGGGGRLVTSPHEGDGYRWWLDECHTTPEGNRCAMTWPVFTSPVSGAVIDLKEGVFEKGQASGRPLRLINMSSINHHSRYAGVTASIKNLMGVVDMTCGFHGPEPAGYFNTHYIGMRPSHATWRWAHRQGGPIRRMVHKMLPEEKAIDFHHTGGALGHWMRTVRRPDLHIVTAEWIGFGSRTKEDLSARPGVSLAAKDPVTLDAVAAREVLMQATRQAGVRGGVFLAHNDPEHLDRPFPRFLAEAAREIGGRPDPEGAEVERVERVG